jgi:hypothetical protein
MGQGLFAKPGQGISVCGIVAGITSAGGLVGFFWWQVMAVSMSRNKSPPINFLNMQVLLPFLWLVFDKKCFKINSEKWIEFWVGSPHLEGIS